MSKQFSTAEVAEHASVEKGLYIIIDGGVYSMSSFVDEHPGGAKILKRVGGKDASKQFWKVSGQSHVANWADNRDELGYVHALTFRVTVPQRARPQEVPAQAQDRRCQGGI
jgi:cytochrome b involved in lipid metabolism